MSEGSTCTVCLIRVGKTLDIKWLEFFQNFGLQHENITLCDLCMLTLLKVKKFMNLLQKSIQVTRLIEIEKPFDFVITKLEAIDILPCVEVYIDSEHRNVEDDDDEHQSSIFEVDGLKNEQDYSTESLNMNEEKTENISERNASDMNFEVTYLSLEEQKNEIQFKKKSVKFMNMLYKCEKCGIGFVSQDAFQDHNLRHENDTAAHVCPICCLHFKSQLVLSQHKLSHKRRFRCTLCGEAFKRWAHALGHRATCGTDPIVAACDVCQKIFTNTHSLEIHKMAHLRDNRFICNECSKSFRTKQHIITHLRTHTGIKPYECTICGKAFTTHSNLKSHKVVHSNDRSFYCVECDKTFKSDKSLKRHYVSLKHTEVKQYSCTACLRTFDSSTALTSHRQSHTSTECFKCKKIFTSPSNLNKHLNNVHAKERNKFKILTSAAQL
ncbi:unnamed protein product [Leptosia nina]|uniref:C2H2-type domain-containing protein n=1 Tax=Leptosia nina TaxID=320188 RepID=A0AAV1JUL1_9NEOP